MDADNELLSRITVRADVFGGKPIIRDMRIAVEHILAMLAAGDTLETILQEYPVLVNLRTSWPAWTTLTARSPAKLSTTVLLANPHVPSEYSP